MGHKKKICKIISIVLAVCMILPELMSPVTAQAFPDIDGEILAGTADAGTITENESYAETMALAEGVTTVSSADQIPAEIPAGAVIELANDIVLNQGQQITTMAGTLDGKGHTITLDGKALIAQLTGTVQNLGVTAAAELKGGISSFGTIADQSKDGQILNCFSMVPISAGFSDAGGLVGVSEGGIIRNSFHGGKITGMMFGGLIGQSTVEEKPSEITECFYAYGDTPVSMGTMYNKDEGRFGKKTESEMKSAAFVEALNANINTVADTGYVWEAVSGDFPKLVPGKTPDVTPGVIVTTVLEEKIAAARLLKQEEYEADTWSVFATALGNAEKALAEKVSQEAVDTAASELTSAMDALVKVLPSEAVKLPEDPNQIIKINSAQELNDLAFEETKGKYYQLTQDIEVPAGMWFPPNMDGVFDGNGHTITANQRVFSNISHSGVIQNTMFTGTIENGAEEGAVAATLEGAIVNCGNNINTKDGVGFVSRIRNGMIANCFFNGLSKKGVFVVRGKFESGTLKNSYWQNTSINDAIPSDAMINSASKTADEMRTLEFRDLMNANKGTAGMTWGQNSDGYPYFGPDLEYKPVGPVENKYAVSFKEWDGHSVVEVKDGKLEVSRDFAQSNGLIGAFELKGVPETSSISWSCDDGSEGSNFRININDGSLYVYQTSGAATVKATEHKPDGTSEVVAEIAVTSVVKEMEELKLFIDDQDVTNKAFTLQGSEDKTIKVQARFKGEQEFRDVSYSAFSFTPDDPSYIKSMGNSPLFRFVKPGTVTMTVASYRTPAVKASVEVTSEYVPVKSIKPSVTGVNVIHQRNSMSDNGTDFNAIETTVIITPQNASVQEGYQVESSNPDVAVYSDTLPKAYIPKTEGSVTFTASITDVNPVTGESKVVKGSSDVTFKYLNPLKKAIAKETEINIKEYESKPLDITYEGERTDGYSVSEPTLNWTYDKKGIVRIYREKGNYQKRVEGEPDSGDWIGNGNYFVEGLMEGTVVATGTPMDQTNHAKPVVLTIHVSAGQAEAIDIPALVKQGKDTSVKAIRAKHEGKGYAYNDEWDVYSMLRAGETLTQEELDGYYNSVAETVSRWKPMQKPTDIERVVLALAVMGKDVTNVNGVDLAKMIYQHKYLTDGSNELTYALLALDAAGIETPADALWSRDKIIESLLTFQNEDGGLALFPNGKSGIDTTAMTLQALAPYRNRPEVAAAIDKGLAYLRTSMEETMDAGSSEADAQVLLALTVLQRDPLTEEGLSTKRKNMITALMQYHLDGEGFSHAIGGGATDMSLVQAFQALESYDRFVNKETTYWDIQNKGVEPGVTPSETPTPEPTLEPSETPTPEPTLEPSKTPTPEPTLEPSETPTPEPTLEPSKTPTPEPTLGPSEMPTPEPTVAPTMGPTQIPTPSTTPEITETPTPEPTVTPTPEPTVTPTPGEKSVVISVERFTIGQGYIVEPVILPVEANENVTSIIKRVIGAENFVGQDNYLEAITGADLGADKVQVPEYISSLGAGAPTTESTVQYYNDRGKDFYDPGTLGQFTYNTQAGWMYHVNGIAPSIGIREYIPENGDVIRVQYTLYGYGTDLTGYEYGNPDPVVNISNKDELTRQMAQINADKELLKNEKVQAAYNQAMEIVQNMTAPQTEVDQKTEDLKEAVKNAEVVPTPGPIGPTPIVTPEPTATPSTTPEPTATPSVTPEPSVGPTLMPSTTPAPTVQPEKVTLVNEQYGVTLEGMELTQNMKLVVTPLKADDRQVALIRKQIPSSQAVFRLFDIKLMKDGKEIQLPQSAVLSVPVGEKYNGKQMTILYCVNDQVSALKGKVTKGYLEFQITSMGSMGVVVDVKADNKVPGQNGGNSSNGGNAQNGGSSSNGGNGQNGGAGGRHPVNTADTTQSGALAALCLISVMTIVFSIKKRKAN